MDGIVVNARFRTQRPTGVQVYAAEIVRRLGLEDGLQPERSLPPGLGHMWEQFLLPGLCRGCLLFSPANTGPLLVRRQVVTIHDAATLDHPEWFSPSFSAWYRWLLPRLAQRVAHVLTVSEFSRERLMARLGLPLERISVVHPGVGDEYCPSTEMEISRVRKAFCMPGPYLLTVGSLDPRKNAGGVLRVWANIQHRLPDHELVLVGGTSPHFRRALGGAIPPRTRLLGYVGREMLPGLYSGTALFVYLSNYEGFGLTPLEAMACGAPVLCSSTTALGEGAGPGACTVHPQAETLAAERALELLQDEARRRDLAARGRAHAAAFTWKSCSESTREILAGVEAATR